ncbi:MAG: hypothetical protein FWE94_03605 [Coriobacteriia bacterium]|nr:hypothetical protein [Coriobacteriia bacterium]
MGKANRNANTPEPARRGKASAFARLADGPGGGFRLGALACQVVALALMFLPISFRYTRTSPPEAAWSDSLYTGAVELANSRLNVPHAFALAAVGVVILAGVLVFFGKPSISFALSLVSAGATVGVFFTAPVDHGTVVLAPMLGVWVIVAALAAACVCCVLALAKER